MTARGMKRPGPFECQQLRCTAVTPKLIYTTWVSSSFSTGLGPAPSRGLRWQVPTGHGCRAKPALPGKDAGRQPGEHPASPLLPSGACGQHRGRADGREGISGCLTMRVWSRWCREIPGRAACLRACLRQLLPAASHPFPGQPRSGRRQVSWLGACRAPPPPRCCISTLWVCGE